MSDYQLLKGSTAWSWLISHLPVAHLFSIMQNVELSTKKRRIAINFIVAIDFALRHGSSSGPGFQCSISSSDGQ